MLCVQKKVRMLTVVCFVFRGKLEEAVMKMLTVVCFIYVATITPSVTQAFFRTLIPGYLPSG